MRIQRKGMIAHQNSAVIIAAPKIILCEGEVINILALEGRVAPRQKENQPQDI